jgi:hypothetical protein
MTTWHKGPPPSIGWWPASICRDPSIFRWWNGKWWSCGCVARYSAQTAARDATVKSQFQDEIEWTERPASWPERART